MINGQQPQVRTYDGNMPVTITLTLNTWQQVMQILAQANPVIADIQRQINTTLDQTPPLESQQHAAGPGE